jgi:hypothetical protein
MPEITSLHPNLPGKAHFDAQGSQTEVLGNRSGKGREWGQLTTAEGYSEAVELFTRSIDAEDYADVWNLYIQEGLPVVPELWQDGEGKVYMPNLTQDGSALYGKAFEQAQGEFDRKAMDAVFVRVWKEQKTEIENTARQLADEVSTRGLLLPLDDAFDLQVHPDGSWNLMILDLEYGGTLDDLLVRKARYTNQRTEAPLKMNFEGKQLSDLNRQEKQRLLSMVNRRSADTALFTLAATAKKIAV